MAIGGAFITGYTCCSIIPAYMAEAKEHVDPAAMAFASGVLMAAMNLGGFVTTPYFALLESIGYGSPFDLVFISAILYFVIAALTFLALRPHRIEHRHSANPPMLHQ